MSSTCTRPIRPWDHMFYPRGQALPDFLNLGLFVLSTPIPPPWQLHLQYLLARPETEHRIRPGQSFTVFLETLIQAGASPIAGILDNNNGSHWHFWSAYCARGLSHIFSWNLDHNPLRCLLAPFGLWENSGFWKLSCCLWVSNRSEITQEPHHWLWAH